jgi:hypothetical protein
MKERSSGINPVAFSQLYEGNTGVGISTEFSTMEDSFFKMKENETVSFCQFILTGSFVFNLCFLKSGKARVVLKMRRFRNIGGM